MNTTNERITRTDDEWQRMLTPEQYKVTRKKGTERAFTGAYWNNHDKGVYKCVCCDLPLFSSEHKFESGTGWPSYWQPINPQAIRAEDDSSFFMRCPRSSESRRRLPRPGWSQCDTSCARSGR